MSRRNRDRDDQEPVDRELAALDAALAGERVDPDLAELETLALAVRAERPVPRDEFVRALDDRAAAGFPRDEGGPADRLRSRVAGAFSSRSGRRMLLPAMGAAASVLIAVVVAVSVIDSGGGSGDAVQLARPSSTAGSGAAGVAPEQKRAAGATDSATSAPATAGARRVEREITLTLAPPADQIDDVSDKIVGVTDGVGGIVVSSSVSTSDNGGGATFELRVPTARLSVALERLSKLAHVRSRTQTSQDITQTFTSAQDRLAESVAERRGLLRQLAIAKTPNETESIRARLRLANGQISAARAAVARLHQRTDYSVVNVTVERGAKSTTGGGAWTPKDALHDSIRILSVAAGVALVAIALLIPTLAITLAAGWGVRRAIRRRREHALNLSV